MTVELLLDAPPALVEGITCEADHVERVHHGDCLRKFLGGGGLEAREAIHRDHLDSVLSWFIWLSALDWAS